MAAVIHHHHHYTPYHLIISSLSSSETNILQLFSSITFKTDPPEATPLHLGNGFNAPTPPIIITFSPAPTSFARKTRCRLCSPRQPWGQLKCALPLNTTTTTWRDHTYAPLTLSEVDVSSQKFEVVEDHPSPYSQRHHFRRLIQIIISLFVHHASWYSRGSL